MRYREFGNTNIQISALGFGAMRLPMKDDHVLEEESIALMHRAFELGVNYVDTAYNYCNEESQVVVGKAVRAWKGQRIYVSTKIPPDMCKTTDDYRRILDYQLSRLDLPTIDFHHFHGLNDKRYESTVKPLNLIDEMRKAKAEGLIQHMSFSFHDKPDILRKFADLEVFESVLLQYNLLDRANEDAIAYARGKGMGIVVMGPVGGGRLAAPSELIMSALGHTTQSTPEVALRFVLGNDNVCCALSGMNTMAMIEENAAVASLEQALSPEEWQKIDAMTKETRKLAELYCTGCDYCAPCPQGIRISRVFSLMNLHKVYGLTETAQKEYARFGKESFRGPAPTECIECGECEKKCPQNIAIREQLKETHATLGV